MGKNVKSKNKVLDVMILVQTVLSIATISFAFEYLYEKNFLMILMIFFSLFMLVLAFNNWKFFKVKFVSLICIVLSVMFILGVVL